MNGFGINDREQEYSKVEGQPKNEKYANGSVGAMVRLMVSGGCVPVRRFKGMEWKFTGALCECVQMKQRCMCKRYDQIRRRWLRIWDGLYEKKRAMDVINSYVEVNDEVERERDRKYGREDKGIV